MSRAGRASTQDAALSNRARLTESAKFSSRRLRTRFSLLSLAFIATILLIVAFSIVAFQVLSGARAYVHGESQWTKAQKRAVIALFDYASTGDSEQYQAFERMLEVNLGDQRARLTLSSRDPNLEVAREGFLAGRNRPEDIELMIRLFTLGQSLPGFSRAVSAWSLADALMAQLQAEAIVLHRTLQQHAPGSPPVLDVLDRIKTIDEALTRQEDRFSAAMGEISHRMTRFVSVAIILIAFLLIGGASILAWRLSRVSERTERALRESEQRYRALVDQPEVGMWQIDPDGRIVFLNPAMRTLLGLDNDEHVEGEPIEQFVAESDRSQVLENRRSRAEGEHEALEVQLTPREGPGCIALVHGAPIRVGDQLVGHVGTCVDITARKEAERELEHQALHDPLTGLPNRKLFLDRLDMAIRRARRHGGHRVAVLFVDLDRFKVVNDGLGHSAGDQLLIEAAARLESVIRDRDSIARFGGDEFGVVLENVDHPSDANVAAERIADAFESSFEIHDVTMVVRASVGLAMTSDAAVQAGDLLAQADIAMYAAKREGGGRIHHYDPEHDQFEAENLSFESALWKAARQEELRLYYQPVVDLRTGKTIALEALVRWQHPERGLLDPSAFVELAEETGAIASIGRWVALKACEDYQRLSTELTDPPQYIAINVSNAEFRFGDPVGTLSEACEATGTSPEALHVEVVETMLAQRPDEIHALSDNGHPIAIDDFGTGYASLDRLRTLPFSILKIDRCFINEFPDNLVDLSIVEAVVQVGRRLNVKVVAEGIERKEQMEALLEAGCHLGQGFLYARPQPLATIISAETGTP